MRSKICYLMRACQSFGRDGVCLNLLRTKLLAYEENKSWRLFFVLPSDNKFKLDSCQYHFKPEYFSHFVMVT